MNKFLNLIKRGGGTGPVKPGNQRKFARWCQFLRDIFLADEVALYMKASSAYVYEGAFSLKKVLIMYDVPPWHIQVIRFTAFNARDEEDLLNEKIIYIRICY